MGKRAGSFSPDKISKTLFGSLRGDLLDDRYTVLCRDPRINSFDCDSQLSGFMKKYRSEQADPKALRLTAITKFLANAERLKDFDFCIPDNIRLCTTELERVLVHARSFCHYILDDFDIEEVFVAAKHSSGTSIGLKFMYTNLEDKFTFPLTGSYECIELFKCYLRWDPQLALAIQSLNRMSTEPMYRLVNSSRSTTVPKDDRGDRFIAVEATLNMFFQKAFERLITERLRPYVDLQDAQFKHGFLAFVSSITTVNGTIDFASASDCLLAVVLRGLTPPKWYCALNFVRSKLIELGDVAMSLDLFSTMGNATTFPLETLVFYSLLYGCSQHERKFSSIYDDGFKRNFSVFGDDCIVPRSFVTLFIESTKLCGFVVNDEKSFYGEFAFRESCGHDYYHGCNVRPLQLKAPVDCRRRSLKPWLNIIWNQFIKKYITYFGKETYCYSQVFQQLIAIHVEHNVTFDIVPDYFPDDSGIKLHGDIRLYEMFPKHLMSSVSVDEHGVCLFQYSTYKFPSHRPFSMLRLWSALKYSTEKIGNLDRKVPIAIADIDERYIKKTRGKYVSATGRGMISLFPVESGA